MEDQASKIQELPDYLNEDSNEMIDRFGDFKYDEFNCVYDESLPILGPYIFQNENIYLGQWKNHKKHGRGTLMMKTGALYEGEWNNNKASGYGRLIYSDGDVYEGQWENGKATGKGIYRHNYGSVYEGM